MNSFVSLLPFAGLGVCLYLAYVWPLVAARRPSAADLARVRRTLDGEAHRIVSITPAGVETSIDRSGTTAVRKYDVEQRMLDGSLRRRLVGVQVSLLSEPTLWKYENGVRTRSYGSWQ